MDLKTFAALVRAMRNHQKLYFKGKSPRTLEECKQLERRVDDALKQLAEEPDLFNQPGEPRP